MTQKRQGKIASKVPQRKGKALPPPIRKKGGKPGPGSVTVIISSEKKVVSVTETVRKSDLASIANPEKNREAGRKGKSKASKAARSSTEKG